MSISLAIRDIDGMPALKYLTRREIKRLLVPIDELRDKTLIQLGLDLGCRVSEIVSIRTKSIHPGYLRIYDEKKDDHRECVFSDLTQGLLDKYLKEDWEPRPRVNTKYQLLFPFSTKTVNRIVKHWFQVAEIDGKRDHWHTLRHTYIVQSLDAGVPINHVVEQTGDSPTTIIRVYGRPSLESRRQMAQDRNYLRGAL